MKDMIKEAAKELIKGKNVVALTGAGISVESGIPPFRGKGGLWEKFDPMEYAHIEAFINNPSKVWSVLLKDMKTVLDKAKPNEGHNGVYKLEQWGILKTVITQNVDSLHQMAGNTDVIEFHGTFASLYCMDCNKKYKMSEISVSVIPPRCSCKGILRPDCVFFGEMIRPEVLFRSRVLSSECDFMLVIGTSAVVQPAGMMPYIAKQNGAKIIEINPEETALSSSITDYFIKGSAGEAMQNLIAEMEKLR